LILSIAFVLVFVVSTGCGVLINPTPEMVVKQDTTEIPSGTGIFDFGRVEVNKTSTTIFTIENNGNTDLKLTGAPMISISGTNAEDFIVSAHPSTPISPDCKTTFSIKFMPKDSREYSAIVSISNNDADANPYTFTLTGHGIIIDINVRQGTQNIPIDIGVFNFGEILLRETSPEYTFTIENIGTATLHLTGTPNLIVIGGSDKGMFTIDQTSTITPIEPGGSSTFTITFTPTSIGTKTAKIIIANTDSDENPYVFTIKGTGIAKEPKFDFNGDGINDVIIGAGGVDDYGDCSGCVYIFFGKKDAMPIIKASDAEVKILGAKEGDLFGRIVSSAGDFNGDGFDDVIIWDEQSAALAGCVYIFFGKSNPPSVIMGTSADVTIYGQKVINHDWDYFGHDVSSAGDFNGDGFGDIIASAYLDSEGGCSSGCAHIFFGKADIPSKIQASNADVKIMGEEVYEHFAISVSNAGDFNNDGFDDVIISADRDNKREHLGAACIFFGRRNPPPKITKSQADVKLIGETGTDFFGYNVSNAGDFNNDGFDDVIVSAKFDNTGGKRSGSAYIFFGRLYPSSIISTANANVKLVGESEGENFSRTMACAGDFNHDGFDEVIVGALSIFEGIYTFKTYIFLGFSTPNRIIKDAANADIILNSADHQLFFGRNIAGAGDFNLDGFEDLIVSATGGSDNGFMSGNAYIFFGKNNLASVIKPTNADIKFNGSNELDGFSSCVDGGY
ncbi:MAG: choice-of-anchor D domain-containing protein, partial [Planctomycetes bacterium]|nr:choice-of-anchor D domain-containing protein [Planctomycetota bacterium]